MASKAADEILSGSATWLSACPARDRGRGRDTQWKYLGRFTWSCLGLQTTEYLALALPSATVAASASASSLESDSFMNNAFGRMVRRGICPGRRA